MHYPQVEANRLRKKGEHYWKNLDLTGSSEGTTKDPKFSLLKAYEEQMIPSVARAFAGHHQMVCAILEHDGDNNYLSERKGMHFGIRNRYMTSAEGDGVIVVPEPQEDGEGVLEQVVADRQRRGLRYEVPDIRNFELGQLNQDQKDILLDHDNDEENIWDIKPDLERTGECNNMVTPTETTIPTGERQQTQRDDAPEERNNTDCANERDGPDSTSTNATERHSQRMQLDNVDNMTACVW